jgi:hypothetical protein
VRPACFVSRGKGHQQQALTLHGMPCAGLVCLMLCAQ